MKAFDIQTDENAVVLGADTLVSLHGKILGKPVDKADAFEMLSALSAQTCEVITAYCLRDVLTGQSIQNSVTCQVTFNHLTETLIDYYIASGEPMDKAGAFAIQGEGRALIREYSGDFNAIVGLPVEAVISTLKKFKQI